MRITKVSEKKVRNIMRDQRMVREIENDKKRKRTLV